MRPARHPHRPHRPVLWLGGCLWLAGCLATPKIEPPVVSTSERRAHYRAELTAVVVMAPPAEATAMRGMQAQVDAAVQRRLRDAGVPTLSADGPASRRSAASHFVRISLPAAGAGRTALQVELRDTLTRSLVWRYAGELDTAAQPPLQQVADRMADAVIHRLREDGLLAR